MSTSIKEMNGVNKTVQTKLAKCGINTVEALLREGCTKKGRAAICKATGLDAKVVLTMVNRADLWRIKGVAAQFTELLEATGVDTVKELCKRKPENLHMKMVEVVTSRNKRSKKTTRVAPSLNKIKNFVQHAKKLKPMITHR